MLFENQGLSMWYSTPDAPAPDEAVPAGVEVPITVGLSPPDASNTVNVHYRTNGGSVAILSAGWFRNDHSRAAQYFTARLPAFQPGDQVELWVTAWCAGKYVPARDAGGTAVLTFRVFMPGVDAATSGATTPQELPSAPRLSTEPISLVSGVSIENDGPPAAALFRSSEAGSGRAGRRARPARPRADPKKVYAQICPPGSKATSYPSNGPIGTAYGKWLGLMYLQERRLMPPGLQTYALVDFGMYAGWGTFDPLTIYDLSKYDPQVVLALMVTDWSRLGLQRTDILDSDWDHVYEIKPRRSAAAGPPQLNRYLTSLQTAAEYTSPKLGPVRPRMWRGGPWDPSPYRFVVPGKAGQICFIHAKQDPTTRGVIVYDIVCCEPEEEEEEPAEEVLVVPVLKDLVKPLDAARPHLEKTLQLYLPRAPVGSTYAYVVPPRFFQLFVIGPWDREQDRQLAKMYGPRPGPALIALVLASWAGAFVVSGELATAAALGSGFLPPDEVLRFYGIKLVINCAMTAFLVMGEAMYAAGATAAVLGLAVEGAAAATAAGEAVAVAEPIAAATAPVVGPLVGTAATGEAVSVGTSLAPWMIGGGATGSTGTGAGSGLTLVAAFAIGLVSVEADAATGTNPGVPAGPVAADPVYLVPTELLVPRRGRIELGAEVTYGEEKFFIIGLVTADAGS